MYDSGGGHSMGPFRVDFFRFSTKIRHPTGSALYESLPAFLKPILHPLFALIYDGKIVAVDQEHFIKVSLINTVMATMVTLQSFDVVLPAQLRVVYLSRSV